MDQPTQPTSTGAPAPVEATASAQDLWLARTHDNWISGPFTKEQVCRLVLDGKLTANDEVCCSSGYWTYLHERQEIQKILGIEVPRVPSGEEDVTETQILPSDSTAEYTRDSLNSPSPVGSTVISSGTGAAQAPAAQPQAMSAPKAGQGQAHPQFHPQAHSAAVGVAATASVQSGAPSGGQTPDTEGVVVTSHSGTMVLDRNALNRDPVSRDARESQPAAQGAPSAATQPKAQKQKKNSKGFVQKVHVVGNHEQFSLKMGILWLLLGVGFILVVSLVVNSLQ